MQAPSVNSGATSLQKQHLSIIILFPSNFNPFDNLPVSGSYLQQPQTVGMGLPRPVATSGLVSSANNGLSNSTKNQIASVSNLHLDHPTGQLSSSSRMGSNMRQLHSTSSLASRVNSQLAIPRATSRLGLATRGIQWTGRHDDNNNNNNNTNNNNK